MIFDINKAAKIENDIINTLINLAFECRCEYINTSPCFLNFFSLERAKSFISTKFNTFSLKEILENNYTPQNTSIISRILSKTITTFLGLIPQYGAYISISLLFKDVIMEVRDFNSDNEINKFIHSRWKKKKRYKKIENIIYIENIASLSASEIKCLQVLSYLISQKYIDNTAIIIICPTDFVLPYLSNCTLLKKYDAQQLLKESADSEQIDNMITILNIIGISYINSLNQVAEESTFDDKTIKIIINSIYEQKNVTKDINLERFLNSCSLLFEVFDIQDVEFIANLQHNKEYKELFTKALTAEIIKDLNFKKFYFIQPFLRDYYQKKNYVFSSYMYNKVFYYLVDKYPESYDDLALASSILLNNKDDVISYSILAYYFGAFTIKSIRLKKIKEILSLDSLGNSLICLDELYCNRENDTEALTIKCDQTLYLIKKSNISVPAKLASLSYLTRMYYELNISNDDLIEISDYYRSLLSKSKILSKPKADLMNFALDYIAFSTCIDNDFPTQSTAQRLVDIIEHYDKTTFKEENYFKYLRLGNAIYPNSPQKAAALLKRGYSLTKGLYYHHKLFGINYSANLIIDGNYREANAILSEIIEENNYSAMGISAKNNYTISSYFLRGYERFYYDDPFELLCNNNLQSDNCICINNSISFRIMKGTTRFIEDVDLCNRIINLNDKYHSFYSYHNLMIIYYLEKDNRFWSCIERIETPFLTKHYDYILKEKIRFLITNFDKNYSIYELTDEMKKALLDLDNCISDFYSYPVLFGLIERWFE